MWTEDGLTKSRSILKRMTSCGCAFKGGRVVGSSLDSLHSWLGDAETLEVVNKSRAFSSWVVDLA